MEVVRVDEMEVLEEVLVGGGVVRVWMFERL